MAINPSTQYPGKMDPATPAYPYGEARNVTVSGDGTGTPWDQALIKDLFGFQQEMLNLAGIVPTGTPEAVKLSQYMEALEALVVGRGHIDGLITSNNLVDPTNDIDVAIGEALSSIGGIRLMRATTAFTKQIDAVWAKGTALGGRASAVGLAANTDYRFFMIVNPATREFDYGWDSSAVAANLLADALADGFTIAKQIMWHRYGAANLKPYLQIGDRVIWETPVQTSVATAAAASSETVLAPPNTTAELFCSWETSGAVATGSAFGLLSPLALSDVVPSGTILNLRHDHVFGADNQESMKLDIPVDASSQIRARFSAALGNLRINCLGFVYSRGANA